MFDQQGAFLEGEPGPGRKFVSTETLQRLMRELPKLQTVQSILRKLESGKLDKAAKPLEWNG